MRRLILILLFFVVRLHAQTPVAEPEEKAPSVAPFSSEEDIEYTAKDVKNFVGSLLSDEFVGIIERPFATNDLRQSHVYEFESKKDVTASVCQEAAAKVYGPLGKISRKVKKEKLHKVDDKMICQIALGRGNEEDSVREYHLFVMNLRKKTYGLEFRFQKVATKAQEENVLKFLEGLK